MNQPTPDNPPDNLVDLMEQLVEPAAPEPVSLAPQTAGWTVLGIVLLAAILVFGFRWFKAWRANAYRREAALALDEAGADSAGIAMILRRTALSAFPREDVASLTGDAWIGFLNDTGGGSFDPVSAERLSKASYQRKSPPADDQLRQQAMLWVKHHRSPREAP